MTQMVSSKSYKNEREFIIKHTLRGVRGVAIAIAIILGWSINLGICLSLHLEENSPIYIGVAIIIQAFLCTGLFITAHDAMHQSIAPQSRKMNDQIGKLTVFLYLFFSYEKLVKNHWHHHRHPASELDPDFHDGKHSHPIMWYFSFIQRYFSWVQVAGIVIVFTYAKFIAHIPAANLFLFWLLPAILSSLQLFYFGTYLPHRELPEGYPTSHRTRSNSLSTLWSFLTCYHFGYHEEHHEYPSIPWWQLPAIRKIRVNAIA